MRFDRISIPAYGRFENLELALPAARQDLHLIYGPNEAGKSTLLRALRGLLYGIDSTTGDAFRHDYKDLLIGADISTATRALSFYRRKGSKNTLLDADKRPLPDDALAPFLGVVDADYFATMFGMSAEELRERGRKLLAGQGQLGQVLFSASLGGTPVEAVIASLSDEADRIHRGRATTGVLLRPLIKEFEEHTRASREALIKPEDYAALESAWRESSEQREALLAALAAAQVQHDQLARCHAALPTLEELGTLEARLASWAEVPDLAAEAIAKARAALLAQRQAAAEQSRLSQQQARLLAEREATAVQPALLARGADIERLHAELALYQKHRKALPKLRADVEARQAALASALADFQLSPSSLEDPSALAALRLPKAAELEGKAAARDLSAASASLTTLARQLAELEAALASQRQQLDALASSDDSVAALRVALAETEDAAQLHSAQARLVAELARHQRSASAAQQLLHGAPAEAAATYALAIPAKAAIRQQQAKLDALQQQLQQALEAKQLAHQQQRQAEQQLAQLQQGRVLPSLAELAAARAARQAAWEALAADFAVSRALPFLEAQLRADALADSLREHAQEVAIAERYRSDIARALEDQAQAEAAEARAQANLDAWQQQWLGLWQTAGLTLRPDTSPAEMIEWQEHWLAFRAAHDQAQQSAEQVAQAQASIAAASQTLAAALGLAAGTRDDLRSLRAQAQRQLQAADEVAGQRQALQKAIAADAARSQALRVQQQQQRQAAEQARLAWQQHCRLLGLPAETSPETGRELAEARERLLDSATQLAGQRRELEASQALCAAFESEARDLITALALHEQTSAHADAQEAALWSALAAAREAHTRHQQLSAQLGETERAQAVAAAQVKASAQDLAIYQAQAHVASLDELPAVLDAIEQKTQLSGQAATLRQTLRHQAQSHGSASIEAFIASVREAAEHAEPLAVRLAATRDSIAQQRQQLAVLDDQARTLSEQKAALEQASDTAAFHRQQAESKAAEITRHSQRLIRLRLAVHLLEQQIETFRKASQGPLLQRSGDIFARLTSGSFTSLGVDYNDKDDPIIVGRRPDGKKVFVEGMSEGTRDQLYLALRFAGLERHLDTHTPMPLILDDLLSSFDDQRSAALLPVLAELSQRTQVLLFTHHEHLLRLAEEVLPGVVKGHRI